ncbi:MAG: hypothetical protein CR217_13995 [Beijerinckiaceae bacterium]|nr:MAG: hypothetical protein CR217_13995 [Beijerinckiaceae bacterium]
MLASNPVPTLNQQKADLGIPRDSLKPHPALAWPFWRWRGVTMAGSHGGEELIAAIYDAIIDPSRWDEVVKRIVEATKSFSGNLVLQQADAGSLTAL